MAIIEREAQRRLKMQGYDAVCLNNGSMNGHSGPCVLLARCARVEGGDNSVFIILKVSLHRLDSRNAEVFLGTEIRMIKQKFFGFLTEADHIRFEVWVSVPGDQFQRFEIDTRGIREICSAPSDDTPAGGRK